MQSDFNGIFMHTLFKSEINFIILGRIKMYLNLISKLSSKFDNAVLKLMIMLSSNDSNALLMLILMLMLIISDVVIMYCIRHQRRGPGLMMKNQMGPSMS